MSIKHNTIANYIGQIYLILIGIVVTPFYLQYLGAEAYGLVGFFTLLQTWLNLLDIGMSPTLGRQVAYARGKKDGFGDFRKLLKSFELIFLFLALFTFLAIYIFSDWLSINWINAQTLSENEISYSITLMGLMIGFRWFIGLYRSGIAGLEDQVWLNFTNIIFATLRFAGSLILLVHVSGDVSDFFEYQLVITFCELLVFSFRFYSKIPLSFSKVPIIYFSLQSLIKVAPFAISVAYTASLWIFVSQVDKLVLSGVLKLSEFGYLSIVLLISGAILSMNTPIVQSFQPRLTLLLSQGEHKKFITLYKNSTQLQVLITLSISLTIAFYSHELIYAFTGDYDAAKWGKKILFWFALGNGVLVIAGVQYGLQVAHGNLKLHVRASTLTALIDLPIVVYVALNYGALGTGLSWFTLRVLWGFVWIPIVHNKFAPGLHMKWLINDVLVIVVPVVLSAYYLKTNIFIIGSDATNITIFFKVALAGLTTLIVSSMSSSFVRNEIFKAITSKSRKHLF